MAFEPAVSGLSSERADIGAESKQSRHQTTGRVGTGATQARAAATAWSAGHRTAAGTFTTEDGERRRNLPQDTGNVLTGCKEKRQITAIHKSS